MEAVPLPNEANELLSTVSLSLSEAESRSLLSRDTFDDVDAVLVKTPDEELTLLGPPLLLPVTDRLPGSAVLKYVS